MLVCKRERERERERKTESKNHIYFKGELTEQDTKCTSDFFFTKDVAAVVTSVFPGGKNFLSAVN